MTEGDRQSGSAPSAATLDRPHGYAKGLGSISNRETLYVDEHDCCSLVDRQMTEGLLDGDAELTFGDSISRVGRLEGLFLA